MQERWFYINKKDSLYQNENISLYIIKRFRRRRRRVKNREGGEGRGVEREGWMGRGRGGRGGGVPPRPDYLEGGVEASHQGLIILSPPRPRRAKRAEIR